MWTGDKMSAAPQTQGLTDIRQDWVTSVQVKGQNEASEAEDRSSNGRTLTDYLRQRITLQVQQHGSRLETRPELKKTVQGQRGHVRFAPPLSSLLHLLFKLHPPEGIRTNAHRGGEVRNTLQ